MFKFVAIAALLAAASAHHVPSSYQKVVLYQTKTHHVEPKVEQWTEKPESHGWEDSHGWEHKAPEKKAWETKSVVHHVWTPKAPEHHGWEQKAAESHGWEAKPAESHGWEQKAESHGWDQKEHEEPANYEFKYEVHDQHTGDIKRQSETAHNGNVKGQYSLIDADGFRRVVEYTADDHHGFQATVKREPTHFKVPAPPKKEEHAQHWW